jgi:hypothetical protein
MPPERFGEVVRSHWAVENRLHWRLDVVMNEDQDRTHLDNGTHLAVLRHMALNVMQKDTTKGSLLAGMAVIPPGQFWMPIDRQEPPEAGSAMAKESCTAGSV